MHRSRTAWRIVASSLLALAIVALASFGVVSAQPAASKASAATGPIKPTRQFTVARKGVLDLSKAPTIKPGDKPASGPPPTFDPMTPQQRAAYEANARKGIGIPPAPPAKSLPRPRQPSPPTSSVEA